jgi:hypothetical protein
MGWFDGGSVNTSRTEKAIRDAVERVVRDALGDAESVLARVREVATLREQIETLKIEKGRKEEEGARREREVEHKVGLERARQKFEVEQSKREATVSIREENLKADRERFDEQLKFHEDRFTSEVGYLKEILGDIVKRLPSAELTGTIGGGKRSR